MVTRFLDAFVSIVFGLNAGGVFLFFGLVFLSRHNKSNLSLKPLKQGVNRQEIGGGGKCGPQQNPACPSANLLTYKLRSHFLPPSLEPLAEPPIQPGCSTGVVTSAISILFHTGVQQQFSQHSCGAGCAVD